MPSKSQVSRAREATRAMRAEVDEQAGKDAYLRSAASMIFGEIERNLAMLDEARLADQPEDIRLKIHLAVVNLVALQLQTGRYQHDEGTLSVQGQGLERLRALSRTALLQSGRDWPEIRAALDAGEASSG